jgi:hypothetical protein
VACSITPENLRGTQRRQKGLLKMKLSNDELMEIITENADRLCVFYVSAEGNHLESLDLTNPASVNGHAIQLNCQSTEYDE